MCLALPWPIVMKYLKASVCVTRHRAHCQSTYSNPEQDIEIAAACLSQETTSPASVCSPNIAFWLYMSVGPSSCLFSHGHGRHHRFSPMPPAGSAALSEKNT